MKDSSRSHSRRRRPLRPRIYHPQLEVLEERLPPGDTVLGGLLARTLVGSSFSLGDDLLATAEGQRIAVAERHPAARGWVESGDLAIQVAARWPALEQQTAGTAATPAVQYSSPTLVAGAGLSATAWEGDLFDALAPFSDTAQTTPPRRLTEGEGENIRPASAEAGQFLAGRDTEARAEPAFVASSNTGYGSTSIGQPAYQASNAGLAALAAAAAVQPTLDTTANAPPSPGAATQTPPASVSPSPQAAVPPAGSIWDNKHDGGPTDPGPGGRVYLETLTVPTENATAVSSRTVLQLGVSYTLIAAGDAKVGTSVYLRGDAGYQDFNYPRDHSADGTGVGLKVVGDTRLSPWGAYHPHHIYQTQVTGLGQALRVFYSDQASAYRLHQGSLTVQLFQSGPSHPGALYPWASQYGETPPTADCGSGDELIDTAPGADGGNCAEDAYWDYPIRWADGTIRHRQGDLTILPSGVPVPPPCIEICDGAAQIAAARYAQIARREQMLAKLKQTRSYTNSMAYSPNIYNGPGMVSLQLPYVQDVKGDGSVLAVVSSGTTQRTFDLNGSNYTGRAFVLDKLVHSGAEFVLTDTTGQQFHFWDFSGTVIPQQGQLKSVVDQAGNTLTVTRVTDPLNPDVGKVAEQQWITSAGGATTSFVYTYLQNPDLNPGLLGNVTLRRKPSTAGAWTTVEQVTYNYYDGTTADGNSGNLQAATTRDAAGTVVLDKEYYRYYKPGVGPGFTNGMKFSYDSASFARLLSFVGDPTVITLSDNDIRPYADHYYEYGDTNNPQQVTKEVAQAAGSSSDTNPGLATFTFYYATTTLPRTDAFNNWASGTLMNLPDGNSYRVYANYYGQPMLRVFHNAGTGQDWEWFIKYDGAGRAILKAQPSALSGYDETKPDLLDKPNPPGADIPYGYLNDGTGRIDVTDYFTGATSATETTAGDVFGYVTDTKVQHGKADTAPALTSSVKYFAHTAAGTTVYPVASTTAYRNSDGTGGETTNYSYTWLSNPNPTVRIQSRIVQRPVVTAPNPPTDPGQNGPGVADVDTAVYDAWGRVIWSRNSISPSGPVSDGYITYTEYDPATAAVSKTIADVDMSKTGDFQNPPSGWTTPSGGGLHLMTQFELDAKGRTTKRTDPVPNPNPTGILPNITYTVYNDALATHEVRTYPGWQSGTNVPTGPTQVTREVRPAAGSHKALFSETLTMSATPALDQSGTRPAGTEAISGVQSLARRITNSGAQVIYDDSYVLMPSLGYSTIPALGLAGTNYYRTTYTYDVRGRPRQVTRPTNTIMQTDYDGLNRVIDVQVGTTSASPVMVSQNVYDQASAGGPAGVGDSNLTQQTLFPRDGSPNRMNQYFYDWRDRPVASKSGVQAPETDGTHRPIVSLYYDNLDKVVAGERYDGDGVPITVTNGVLDVLPIGKRRARVAFAYDNQQRVYQVNTFSVNQSDGTLTTSSSLNTNKWYDHRGNLIKVSEPGGLVTKTQYDGAGRRIKVYTTDEVATPSWADASIVTNNNVLSQTETTYDSNNNSTLVVDRQRFHNETTLGALGTPTVAPLARVSYAAGYYDVANRLSDAFDLGTYGANPYTRPATANDPANNPGLRTRYGYKADAVQQVTLTGSPTGGTFTLNYGAQITAPIAYNAAAADVQSALQALSSIGTNNALVSGSAGGPWLVRFAGTLAETSVTSISGDGSGLTGGGLHLVLVVTPSQGGDTGRVQKQIDPRGLIAKSDYDLLGRTLRSIEAFSAFVPSNSNDRTTEYTYDGDNNLLTYTAVLPGGVQQQTVYSYVVTGSVINSNDLLASVTYPGQTPTESYTYNALSQVASLTDRNATVHSYTYDVLGRQTKDAATTLGQGVDPAVQRLETAYDTGGRAYLFSSYSASTGGTLVNQVQRSYNGLGQLTNEYQSHSGAVNTGSTPQVQYAYSVMIGGANHSRLTSMTYPNTSPVRTLTYNYNGTTLDNSISRLTSITDSGTTLENYAYLGLDTVVKRGHPEPGVDLTYIQQITDSGTGDGGDQYRGLDRFGRVVDQRWIPTSSPQNPTDRFQYSYDQDSNRLTRNNLLRTQHDFDESYSYDNFNQLTNFTRASHTQTWTLDPLGNWTQLNTDIGNQTRGNNTQNQITSLTGTNQYAGWVAPTYDNNGNTVSDQFGKTLVYDAWNRLVQYKSGSTVLGSYAYDALGRRVSDNPGTARDLYYSAAWEVLEERSGGNVTQYVWSPGLARTLGKLGSLAPYLFGSYTVLGAVWCYDTWRMSDGEDSTGLLGRGHRLL